MKCSQCVHRVHADYWLTLQLASTFTTSVALLSCIHMDCDGCITKIVILRILWSFLLYQI